MPPTTAFRLSHIEDRHDVGMFQPRNQFRFTHETLDCFGIIRPAWLEDLQRDFTI